MKIIKEHINEKFIEENDPIQDLGIGIHNAIQSMINKIFIIDSENKEIKKLTSIGNIQYIRNNGRTLSITFYSNRYYTHTGKEIDKKQYAIQLLKESGLDQLVDIESIKVSPPEKEYIKDELYSPWIYTFIIKEEYIDVFKELEYQFIKPPFKKY